MTTTRHPFAVARRATATADVRETPHQKKRQVRHARLRPFGHCYAVHDSNPHNSATWDRGCCGGGGRFFPAGCLHSLQGGWTTASAALGWQSHVYGNFHRRFCGNQHILISTTRDGPRRMRWGPSRVDVKGPRAGRRVRGAGRLHRRRRCGCRCRGAGSRGCGCRGPRRRGRPGGRRRRWSPRPAAALDVGVSPPTVSHHPKLKEACLLASERRGTWVFHRLEPRVLAAMGQALRHYAG